ncbi:MAG: hypothetical protein ACE5GQ_05995, partial [Nitrospinales bacterium]
MNQPIATGFGTQKNENGNVSDEMTADDSRRTPGKVERVSAARLREICLEEGADDAGFVEIERQALSQDRGSILDVFPKTRALISLVQTMNRENIQSPPRYVANAEFHQTIDDLAG